MGLLSKVFELKPEGLNWARGVMFLDVALVPLVVLLAIGEERCPLSAVFGVLFAGAVDLKAPTGTGRRTSPGSGWPARR